ncbi:MAG: acyltransferase family protein [Actinomycetota bacterium]
MSSTVAPAEQSAAPSAGASAPGLGDRDNISRVPYMPGLDGMRAIAVVAVMIYHANPSWLPGGFLGVEMFFVISGYLITLLIIAERERTYKVSLVDFWRRRARRLLPAVFVLLALVTIYTVLFEPDAVGALRGDVIAGLTYVSNWYQLWVGLGYTAAFDFAPLRHLWSLAVEEQFYVVWPLVMVLLLGRRGTRRIADVSRWLFIAAVGIAIVTAMLYHPGVIGEPEQTPEAYWWIGDRPISKLDFLYIGTFSRASGILLGAAFAMVWRPFAIDRGPLGRRGRLFDVFAIVALIGFAWMVWNIHLVGPDGAADGRLFRGGLFVCSALTIVIIAAVTHPRARVDRALSRPVLLWIGTRSYGLYLYHWPIYQAIRGLAGNKLAVHEFLFAMVLTAIVTELSYRLVEVPIRQGGLSRLRDEFRSRRNPVRRRTIVAGGAAFLGITVFAGAALVTADVRQNEIVESFDEAESATVDLAGGGAGGVPSARVTIPIGDPADASRADSVGASTNGTGESGDAGSGDVDDAVPDLDGEGAAPGDLLTPVDSDQPGDPPVDAAEADTGATGDDAPVATTPVVPASTVPPPVETLPDPGDAVDARSLGLVTDLDAIEGPMVIPAPLNEGAPTIIALGDSVMLGAADELAERGVVVDAVVSRQFTAFLPDLEIIRQSGALGSVVIVHLGTNGSFPQASLDRMIELLWDVPIVVFVTGRADRGWIAGNNEKLRELAGTRRNVTVVDWEQIGPRCPDDCFYSDAIHLNQRGQDYYVDVLRRIIAF